MFCFSLLSISNNHQGDDPVSRASSPDYMLLRLQTVISMERFQYELLGVRILKTGFRRMFTQLAAMALLTFGAAYAQSSGTITILAGTPQSVEVGNVFPVRFKVLVKDSANNPVRDVPVVFQPPFTGASGVFEGHPAGSITINTDSTGIAEAPRFVANIRSGRYTVTASVTSVPQPAVFQLTNRAGPPRALFALAGMQQSAEIGTAFPVQFSVAIRDSFDNPVPAVVVRWAAPPPSGPSGTFFGRQDTTAETDSSGIATAPVFVANLIAGFYLVTGSTTLLQETALYALQNRPGSPTSLTVFDGSPQSTRVNTPFGIRLRALVRDRALNTVPNVLVRFRVPSAGPTGRFTNGIDTARSDGTGVATAGELVANVIAGTFAATATTDGVTDTARFILTNRPGAQANIAATGGTPQATIVNTPFPLRFTAFVRDSFANAVPGVPVTFLAPTSGASGFFDGGNVVLTDDSGTARANVFRANAIAGSYQVQGRVDGVVATATYDLTNIPDSAAHVVADTVSTPQSTIVNTSFPVPLRVKVTDGSGNPLSNIAVIFTAPASGASGTFAGGATTKLVHSNANGIADADTFRANTIAGSYTVLASSSGTSAPAIFSLTNRPASLNKFLIEAAAGGSLPNQLTMVPFNVKISATDIYNNVVPGFSDSVMISSNGSLRAGGGQTGAFTNGVLTRTMLFAHWGTNVTLTATRTPGGVISGTSNAFRVDNPVPVLSSVTPNTGGLGERKTLVVRGRHIIDSVTTLLVGTGITLDSLIVVDTTQLRAAISIVPTATLGDRAFRLVNAGPGGGASDTLHFTVGIVVPPAPVLYGPANASRNNPRIVRLSWSSAPAGFAYHLQIGTDSLAPTSVFNDTTLIDTAKTLELGGAAKFFWRARSKNPQGWGPFSIAKSFWTIPVYPSGYVFNTSIPFPTRQNPGDYFATDYRMVGLPGYAARKGIRLDQLLGGLQNVDWVVYRDNGAPQNFYEPYNGSAAFSLTPGNAFWILRKGSWVIRTDSIPTASLDSALTVTVPLQKGWNIITNPYTLPIPWSEVQRLNNITEPLYGFNGTVTLAPLLVPFEGYYVFNSSENSFPLKIPFGLYTSALEKTSQHTAGDWKVSIELLAGGFADRTLSCGVARGALPGRDSVEHHKPRLGDGIPTVYFNRPEWDAQYSSFVSDFRPNVNDLESWMFVANGIPRGDVALHFSGIEDVPAEFAVYLVDRERSRFANLRVNATYRFSAPTGSSSFTLLVGKEEAVREAVGSVLPKEFSLGDNFPNPFNPATSIPVALPRTADISLKIYNILGEEVRTIVAGMFEAGKHFFVWDGTNERGNTVASGIYLARLSVMNGPTFTRKMTLMK